MNRPPPADPQARPAGSAFWAFSLAFYARPDVPDACLALQDHAGADVNVLLYLLHLARSGRRLDATDVERIESAVAAWREGVVRPLRGVRRLLKAPPTGFDDAATAELRSQLKRIELEAERLQQLVLERDLPADTVGHAHDDAAECARRNVGLYAGRLGGFPPAAVETLLRRFCDT